METDLEVDQFLNTIYRYIQLGVHIKAYYSKQYGKFHRELDEVVEFYVDDNNKPQSHIIYQKLFGKAPITHKPSKHLIEYLENQNIDISSLVEHMAKESGESVSEENEREDESGDIPETETEAASEIETESVSEIEEDDGESRRASRRDGPGRKSQHRRCEWMQELVRICHRLPQSGKEGLK